MNTGFIVKDEFKDYKNFKDAYSRSDLVEAKISLLNFYRKVIGNDNANKKVSDDMLVGSIVHCLCLEPDKFDNEYFILDQYDARKKEGKEYLKKAKEENQGKTLIKKVLFKKAKDIADTAKSNKLFNSFVDNSSLIENSIYFIEPESGLRCKTRPDVIRLNDNIIIDLKTCNNSSLNKFKYSIFEKNYHIQAAMQVDGYLSATEKIVEKYIFVVLQNTKPYEPYFYEIDERIIESGRHEYKQLLLKIKHCLHTNKWDEDHKRLIHLMHPKSYDAPIPLKSSSSMLWEPSLALNKRMKNPVNENYFQV